MKAFFRYGLVVSCGSLVMLTSLWSSEDQGARQIPGSYPAASEGQHEGLGNDAQEQLVGKAMRSFQE